MKKRLHLVLTSSVLVACTTAPVPHVPAYGKYGQLLINDQIVLEIDYKSATACGNFSNINSGLNSNASKALANGSIALKCSETSATERLTYQTTGTNKITGITHDIRYVSKTACELLLPNMSKETPTWDYKCV
jgi:hypothetical protein